jgi:dihydroflavonol-4-reductase
MVLGPPAGDQFGEAAEGVEAAIKMRGVPGRGAAWIVIDVRDLAAIHIALLESGRGPRRYMAGGKRVTVDRIASLIGAAADRRLAVYPVPDVALRALGSIFDVIGDQLPFETPINSAAMQYYTQMPLSDDEPSERELGVVQRDPEETVADTVEGLQRVGRI